jgi:ribose 5-phosphate isomerase B
MKISIGSDHGGYEIKQSLQRWLNSKSLTVEDFGSYNSESVDYPVYAHLVAKSVQNNECDFGILVCGSGQGMAITANKYNRIRAALCWDKTIAALARQHNNSNILVLLGRFISDDQAIEITKVFLLMRIKG